MDNNFIVEKGVLKAYLGSPKISGDFVLPEGIKVISGDFLQENLTSPINIIFPSTFETFEEGAFSKAIVNCYDFSKCDIKDISNLPFGSINKIILPNTLETLAVKDSDNYGYVVTFEQIIIAHDGTQDMPFDFSACKNLKKISFAKMNKNATIEKFVLPSCTLEFNQGGLSIKEFVFDENCEIEKLTLASAIDGLVVPKSVKEFKAPALNYLFLEGKLQDIPTLNVGGPCVVEDVTSVEFVDKSSEGVRYYKTNKGIIITYLDNNIAKFDEVPSEYDGQKVIALAVLDPFAQFESAADKLTNIKAKVIYQTNNSKKKVDDLYNKYSKDMTAGNCLSPEYDVYANESTLNRMHKVKKKLKRYNRIDDIPAWAKWVIPLIPYFIIFTLVGVLAENNIKIINLTGNTGKIIAGIIEVFAVVLYFFSVWLLFYHYGDRKENLLRESVYPTIITDNSPRPKITEICNIVDEPYKLKAIFYLDKKLKEKAQQLIKDAKLSAELRAMFETALYGTPEERREKARKERIEASLKEIANATKNESYNVYDKNGNEIMKIDKK